MRAFAHDISVSKELFCFLIIILFAFFLNEFPVIIELLKEVAGHQTVGFARRTAIDIKADSKLFERFFDEFMIAVTNILWRDSFLFGTQSDWHAVLITTANEDHLLLFKSQIAYIDVGRNVYSREMSYVNTSICIRQCRGNCCAFEFLLFHLNRWL